MPRVREWATLAAPRRDAKQRKNRGNVRARAGTRAPFTSVNTWHASCNESGELGKPQGELTVSKTS